MTDFDTAEHETWEVQAIAAARRERDRWRWHAIAWATSCLCALAISTYQSCQHGRELARVKATCGAVER